MRECSVEGCASPGEVVLAGRVVCRRHADEYRCSVEGCDCWADGAVAGHLLCRHHSIELRQTGRFPKRAREPS